MYTSVYSSKQSQEQHSQATAAERLTVKVEIAIACFLNTGMARPSVKTGGWVASLSRICSATLCNTAIEYYYSQ